MASEYAEPAGSHPESGVIAAIALGGVLGAEARYGVAGLVRHPAGTFPWSTVVINATGCLLIAALMVVLLEIRGSTHRLVRPFLGIGVLGGYTTFSTFSVELQQLLTHRPLVAVGYLLAMLTICAGSVWLGTAAARRIGGVDRATG